MINFTRCLSTILKNIFIGLFFSLIWASASVATKFGLLHGDPFILSNIRFGLSGGSLLLVAYLFNKGPEYRLPKGKEWKQLTIFGVLNTALFLMLYVWGMKHTSAGIGSLAVATNPLFLTFLSAVWLRKRPSRSDLSALFLGLVGVAIASYPLIGNGDTSLFGISLILLSMFVISSASVYYASVAWQLPNILLNGWQIFIGGVLLLPFTLLFADWEAHRFDPTFWKSVLWLSFAVSVVSLACWFYLLKIDTIKASMWLFLCPIFGFYYAWLGMDEAITSYTIGGTLLVLAGLCLSILAKGRRKSNQTATTASPITQKTS
jgi:drug/metabolite transporter (DMT)-like permease